MNRLTCLNLKRLNKVWPSGCTLFSRNFASKPDEDHHDGHEHHGEHFNEPGGRLFGRPSGLPKSIERLYYFGFIGGLGLLIFLYQYKPGLTPDEWGRQEALRRMR